MVYCISIKPKALKALELINDPYYSKIKEAIYSLSANPRPVGYIKLKGRQGYRIRIAHYRIIYEIFDDVLVVDIINIGHRKDIYE